MKLPTDRIHRVPRVWSNRELRKHAPMFEGEIVNVSGWKDIDKEGRRYRDYFTGAASYTITNYKADSRGFQGFENEIFLDLEAELPGELREKFDVVFNHTTLEHIYHFQPAFRNLCTMSRDIVIIVLPFLQQYHSHYGDYWRFTPLALKRMFEDEGFELVYQSFNGDRASSVYTYTIATRNPGRWRDRFEWSFTCEDSAGTGGEPYVGCHAIPNRAFRFSRWLTQRFKRWRGNA